MKSVVFYNYPEPVPHFGNSAPVAHSAVGLDFYSERLGDGPFNPFFTNFGMPEMQIPTVVSGIGYDTPRV